MRPIETKTFVEAGSLHYVWEAAFLTWPIDLESSFPGLLDDPMRFESSIRENQQVRSMSLYVAAYDVSSDFARDNVARVLLDRGQRLQRSVFLIWMEPEEIAVLRGEVGVYLARQDRFDLIPVDEAPTRSRWSWQRPPESFSPVILR